jgi:ankyrin repeat protein
MMHKIILSMCLILTLCLQPICAQKNQLTEQVAPEKKSWWTSTKKKIVFGLSAIGAAAVIVAGGVHYRKKQALNNSLFWAVFGNNTEPAIELLEQGADPNYFEKDGLRLLYQAVGNHNTKMVKALLDHGANPDVSGVNVAPLAIAVENDDRDIIRELVKAGAQIEGVKMRNGQTVKDCAEENGNVEVLQIFRIDRPKTGMKK